MLYHGGTSVQEPPALAGILSFVDTSMCRAGSLLQIGTGVYETAIYSAGRRCGRRIGSGADGERDGHALGIAVAFGVFWFGLTVWLMRNKLNLE